jgi:CubicO group peptidase (beta-lactamase class C family)
MARSLRVVRNLVIILGTTYLALFAFTRVINYPEPVAAVRLGLAPASKTPTLMPSHEIEAASTPALIPQGEAENMPDEVTYRGRSWAWNDWLVETNTNALLVIRDGRITHEWYRPGFNASTRLPSYSVAKTMTSILIGQLVDAGQIRETDRFIDFYPEFAAGTSFDDVTVAHLLDMQAGIGVSDNYPTGPSGWGVAIAQMYATTDMTWFLGNNRRMAFDPGTSAEYRSVDTQLLGMIIKKVTGDRISEVFERNVWQAIGAEFPATWNVDRVGGTEKAFCCFNATAKDYAKVGLAMLNGGESNGRAIISRDWLTRMSTPVVELDGIGYAAQVWHPFPGIYMAQGLHGQFIWMDPENNTVIIKLSDNPTGDGSSTATREVLMAISKGRP